jgi:hypothetical protein
VNTAEPGATAWTSTELATIDSASEIEVATRRADGSPRTARIVWSCATATRSTSDRSTA